MNREEATGLLAMVVSLDHRRDFGPEDVIAWHAVLHDVPWQLAHDAVIQHYRQSAFPIMPSDVVRRAAAAAGLLCPAEADGWVEAVTVAQAGGQGRGQLHPVVRAVYDALGGANGVLVTGLGTARAQFRDHYTQVATRQDEQVLSGQDRQLAALDPAQLDAPEPRGAVL